MGISGGSNSGDPLRWPMSRRYDAGGDRILNPERTPVSPMKNLKPCNRVRFIVSASLLGLSEIYVLRAGTIAISRGGIAR